MLSDLLGLTIDKDDLNKSSPSPVVKSLKKTATNYLAIGKMAEDLKLIKLNFSRWLAMEGVKVRGTPDTHLLKEDELAKKFSNLREKYTKSKVSLAARDGTSGNKGWTKNLLIGFIGYKFKNKLERTAAAAVLKKIRKLTIIRKLASFKRKIINGIKGILKKLDLKKYFLSWFKKNAKLIIDPLIKVFTNAIKRFVKKGLTQAIQRATVAVLASIWSGPFLPIVAGAVLIGMILWEPIKEAWESFTKGEDFIEKFIVSVLDSLTFGIFGEENIKNFKDLFTQWLNTMTMKVFGAIEEAIKFVEEKFTEFSTFIIEKGKSLFTVQQRPEDFKSALVELNEKRAREETEFYEKYGKWFDQMSEAIESKKIKIRQLELEIASLEYDIKVLVEGPEKANLEAAKVEKAKEEKEKAELEKKQKELQVGDYVEEEKKSGKKEKTPAAKPQPKKEETKPKAVEPPPKQVKPEPASTAKPPTPSKTDGKYEDVKQMIMANEGYKTKPYKDSRGLWTVGVGHLIGNGKKMPVVDPKHPELGMITENRVFSPQEIRSIFDKDFEEHLQAAEKSPGWDKSNDAGKAGLIDLTYNVGPYWYKKLKDAASLLTEGKFVDAAKELEKTGWYKQVKGRAVATVSLIRSGAANDKSGSSALASVMSSQKVASAGKFMGQESTQVAQAQREQMKPKDVNVAKMDKTNNTKQTNYQNVAMGEKPDSVGIVTGRAA